MERARANAGVKGWSVTKNNCESLACWAAININISLQVCGSALRDTYRAQVAKAVEDTPTLAGHCRNPGPCPFDAQLAGTELSKPDTAHWIGKPAPTVTAESRIPSPLEGLNALALGWAAVRDTTKTAVSLSQHSSVSVLNMVTSPPVVTVAPPAAEVSAIVHNPYLYVPTVILC